MTQNGQKITPNDQKWPKITLNGLKWPKNDPKWPKNDISEMLRFTHFARHKFSADRHLKLFCTPGVGWQGGGKGGYQGVEKAKSAKLEFTFVSAFWDNSSFGLNILGPLCLWQCFSFHWYSLSFTGPTLSKCPAFDLFWYLDTIMIGAPRSFQRSGQWNGKTWWHGFLVQ